MWLRETVAARETRRETERIRTRLLNQVDERRSLRTGATVNELLDRWLDVVEIDGKTQAGYVGKIEKPLAAGLVGPVSLIGPLSPSRAPSAVLRTRGRPRPLTAALDGEPRRPARRTGAVEAESASTHHAGPTSRNSDQARRVVSTGAGPVR